MPPQETGKQRAARIPLDYYKTPDRLSRWKRGLAILALLLAIAWPASAFLRGPRGEMDFSRGPVAAVHATWDANCNACHTPFTPISGDAVFHSGDTTQRCTTCHMQTEHQVHHKGQTPDLACASCHREHRGRDASLVRIPDGHCTHCHANLAAHVQAGTKTKHADKVTRFDKDNHPRFPSVANDPGRLKFNHQLHLSPGMATAKGGNPNFTLDKIPEADRKRYRQPGQKDTELVRLDCASCHRLDSGDFGIKPEQLVGLPGDALLPKRSPGAYMQPIVYENQCKACHPLSYKDPEAGRTAEFPHRFQPDQVRRYLASYYTDEILKGKFNLFEQKIPTRPLPGQLPVGKNVTETVRLVIEDKVEKALRYLLQGKTTCGECHSYETRDGKDAPVPTKVSQFVDLRVGPTKVPDVWLKHASFNHAAHRALNCKECHPRAYPDSKDASTKHSDVLIPSIDNCVQCHAPQRVSGGAVQGGARTDCVECHRYHNGHNPLQGIGADARGVPEGNRLDLKQFLSGGTEKK